MIYYASQQYRLHRIWKKGSTQLSHPLCSCRIGDISLVDKLGTGFDEPCQQGTCLFQPDIYDFDQKSNKIVLNKAGIILKFKHLIAKWVTFFCYLHFPTSIHFFSLISRVCISLTCIWVSVLHCAWRNHCSHYRYRCHSVYRCLNLNTLCRADLGRVHYLGMNFFL